MATYTPARAEIEHVFIQYCQASHRTLFLIQLKLLQRLGYSVPLASVCDARWLATLARARLLRELRVVSRRRQKLGRSPAV